MTVTFDALESQARLANLPWNGSIELTHRCNERCAMCYLGPDWGKGRKSDELTTAEVFDLLDQLKDAGCFELLFTGGEVCLRHDLIEILDYAGSLGFAIRLKTNGTMVTPELVDAITRNPVKTVDMSLLGASAETHDGVTKIPGSFDRMMRGIKLMRAAGVHIQLNFTTLTLNFREINASKQLAESLGCGFGWSTQVSPRDDRSVIPLKLRVPKEDMKPVFEQSVKELGVAPDKYPNEGWFCGAGRFSFNINPYGVVEPCMLMRREAGNIREESFADIWWNSEPFKRLRQVTIADVYGCKECKVKAYCSACPGLFMMEMGDIIIPSPETCEQAEMRQEAATGRFVPCGARDADGNLPTPLNTIWGGAGHKPIPIRVKAARG